MMTKHYDKKFIIVLLTFIIAFCGKISKLEAYTEQSVDLYDYVENTLNYTASGSGNYVIPSSTELTIFNDCIDHLLNEEISEAEIDCNNTGNDIYDINFNLIKIDDTGTTGENIYCLKEDITQGQGFFCINYNSSKKHHVSVPHSLMDLKTNTEAIEVMRGIGARYLSIATTHRCANSGSSSCDGTTPVCGGGFSAFKESDMAHNVDSFFHSFGTSLFDFDSSIITLQLHGCPTNDCPSNIDSNDIVARLSVGATDNVGSNELVNRLKRELNDLLASFSEGIVKSCNDFDDDFDEKQCGTTNPLGRYINGETSSPCDTAPTSFTNSRFLHIEQNGNLRNNNNDINPALLINALNSTLYGFTVSSIGNNTTEAGGTATFTVKLDSEPDGNVALDVISSDIGEGTVSPSSLTFTTANWNTNQEVTVAGMDDSIADGNQNYTIQLTLNIPLTADSTGYASLDPDDVSFINTDNDTVGFTISSISGKTTEAGGTATFTAKLNSEPDGNVVLDVISSDTGEGTISPSSLTFTTTNWNTNQEVTVTGMDDSIADGNQNYTIQLALNIPLTADTTGYASLDPNDVLVTNTGSVTNTGGATGTGIATGSSGGCFIDTTLISVK